MIDAMEASSIHTSLASGSAATTIASAASFTNAAPDSLQKDNFSSVFLSSTTMNCQQLERLEDGAIRAAFSNVST